MLQTTASALSATVPAIANTASEEALVERACAPHAWRSVEIRQSLLGADPHVAADIAALAALVHGQGRYAEAEALYQRALRVFEEVYGSEHYEVAFTLGNLAAAAHCASSRRPCPQTTLTASPAARTTTLYYRYRRCEPQIEQERIDVRAAYWCIVIAAPQPHHVILIRTIRS